MCFARIRQWWHNRKQARNARRHPGFASGGIIGNDSRRYAATGPTFTPRGCNVIPPDYSSGFIPPPMAIGPHPGICITNVIGVDQITQHLDNPATDAAFVAAIAKGNYSFRDDGGGSSQASSYESCTSSDSGSSYDSGGSSDSGGCSSGE
jgi:hypothetical protein